MPLGLYALFPFLTIGVYFVIISLLPLGIRIHENSLKILNEWRRNADGSVGNRELKRRLKAMRPITFYSGFLGHYFYYLDKSVMTTYFMAIVDYSTTLLISIPSGKIKLHT
jgi:hypothetical protein